MPLVSRLPRLSIVIPSHNRPDLLALCLASVRRHAPTNAEVLVVDDASPNETVARTAARFSGVDVLRLERNRGFCAAVNAGVAASIVMYEAWRQRSSHHGDTEARGESGSRAE